MAGSVSRGGAIEPHFVVLPVTGSRRKQATEIELALVGVDLPVNLIVVTPEDLERQRHHKGNVVSAALREGLILYERVTPRVSTGRRRPAQYVLDAPGAVTLS